MPKKTLKNFKLGLAICALAVTTHPALAGVPGGSNVNVNVTSTTNTVTQINEISNDIILESLWKVVGEAWRENKKGKIPPPKHWNIEVTVSDPDLSAAISEVKSQLYDLAVIPGRRNAYSVVQDEQTESQQTVVSQSYEEVLGDTTTETTQTVDAGGATFGVDYIGDPNNYQTWIAIGPSDVNVDVNQITTTTQFIDAITTTEYQSFAVWSITGVQSVSPLLLDLDGNGQIQASGGKWLPHTEVDRSRLAFFDFHGDKFPVLMEWPGPQDGILCSPNPDGSIDGTNLFGTSTGFSSGFEHLKTRDSNGDDKISGEELQGLSVWTDLNSDARPQKGEVKTVTSLNISELTLKHNNFVASFVQEGKSKRMYDWWPQTYSLDRVKVMPKNT